MSGSTKGNAPASHNRAATYNVSKDSGRLVKWITLQGDELTDTRVEGFNNLREKSSSTSKSGSVNFLDSSSSHLKSKLFNETLDQPKRFILPSLTSRTTQSHTTLSNTCDEQQSRLIWQECSQTSDKLIMSSKDTRASPKSDKLLRKEDTFIVTDNENRFNLVSPTDELRRRKALVLAKANARHAVKEIHNPHFHSQSTENHRNAIPQFRSLSNQPHFRSYIKSISSEIRNNKGEKIYFHWTEGVLSGGSHASRVPQGVRKLYEYKRKRLKQKYSNFHNSKSAPNNESGFNNLQMELLRHTKRGKTADDAAPNITKGSTSGRKRRIKSRVAFIVGDENDINKTVIRQECHLPMAAGEKGGKKHSSVSVSDLKNEELINGVFVDEVKSIEKTGTRMVDDVTETSSSTNLVNLDMYADNLSLGETDCREAKTSVIIPRPPSRTKCFKEKVPGGANKKVHFVSRSQISRPPKKERSEESSQTGLKTLGNKKCNSTISSESDESILNSNSNNETVSTSLTQHQKIARFDSKCGDIISSIHTRDPPSTKSIKYSHLNGLVGYNKDNDRTSYLRKEQLFCRNSNTKVVSGTRLSALKIAQSVHNDKEQINHHSQRESIREDRVLTGSFMSTRISDRIQEPVSGDDSTNSARQFEHTIHDQTNVILNSSNNINFSYREPDNGVHIQQDNSHSGSSDKTIRSDRNNREEPNDKQEVQATRHDKGANLSPEIDVKKLRFEEKANTSNDSDLPTVKSRTEDGISIDTHDSNQTRFNVEISNARIDQTSVKKSCVASVTEDKTCDPEILLKRIPIETDTQSRVTKLKSGNGVETCPEVGRPRQEASVATATPNVNREVTTTVDKYVLTNNSSLPRLIESRRCCEYELCLNELARKDFSSGIPVQEEVSSFVQEEGVSKIKPLENSKDVFLIANSKNPDETNEHVNSAGHDSQSITDGLSNKLLSLNLVEINRNKEVKTPALSICRYRKETDLPNGGSHLPTYEQNNRNMATKSVSPIQSNTLMMSPKVEETKLGLCLKISNSINGVSSEGGTTKDLSLTDSVNSKTRFKVRSVNKGSYEETSIPSLKSINEREIISQTNTAKNISSCGDSNSNVQFVKCEDFASGSLVKCEDSASGSLVKCEDSASGSLVKCEDSASGSLVKCEYPVRIDRIEAEQNSTRLFPKCANSSVEDGKICIHLDSTRLKSQDNGRQEACRCLKKDSKYSKTELQEKYDFSGNKHYQGNQIRKKEQEKKREALSLPTHNMELVDIPKRKETHMNGSVSSLAPQKSNKIQEGKGAKKDMIASIQGERNENGKKKLTNHMSDGSHVRDDVQLPSSRPKTAGLSAFRKPVCDDLWSVRTDGDDDDDDQIQFIEGEQDFFKVFGYNEETVAILNATQVYPVSGSVDSFLRFGQYGGDVAVANYGPTDGRINRSLLNGAAVNSAVVSDAVVSGSKAVVCLSRTAVGDSVINESISLQKCEDSLKSKDQKKQAKITNNLALNADNSVENHGSGFQTEKQTDLLVVLNVPGNLRNSTQQSQNQPITETQSRFGDNREVSENKGRRRIHSEADIVTTNIDATKSLSVSDSCSDGFINNQTGSVIHVRNGTMPNNKETKTHVALRNKLATERHINQTRYHNNINNNLTHYQKTYLLQTLPVSETQTSKLKDKVDTRINGKKDSFKGGHFRGLETSIYQDEYLQAADRIMSRIAEHSHHSNYGAKNMAGTRIQETSIVTSIVNSPSLRRMSHPVDNRVSPHISSYSVAKPRKLEPIAQVAGVKQTNK